MFRAFYLSKQAILEALKEERGDSNDSAPPAMGIVIGKFSPLTIGHKKMINQLIDLCNHRELIPVVAIIDTGAVNNTDRLLSGEERKAAIEQEFPTVEVMITANAFQALVNVKETGGDLAVVVCGEDRVEKYRDLSLHIFDKDYQEFPPDVVSLSRTDPDDPVSQASSTKAREAAANGDLKNFAAITGMQMQQAEHLMNILRTRMGIE